MKLNWKYLLTCFFSFPLYQQIILSIVLYRVTEVKLSLLQNLEEFKMRLCDWTELICHDTG